MQKIIFLTLSISVLVFIIYLAVSAIRKGLEQKKLNNLEDYVNDNSKSSDKNLSDELVKLNQLFKAEVLSEEEFEKAKKKLLEK
jgi:hypothetical protein